MASAASADAAKAVSLELRVPPLAGQALARPSLTGLGSWFAELVAPFPLESYLEHHFTKTGDQTRAMVETYLRVGNKNGLAMASLQELAERVAALRRSPSVEV
jgi:2-dehydropantoate 2-reductase